MKFSKLEEKAIKKAEKIIVKLGSITKKQGSKLADEIERLQNIDNKYALFFVKDVVGMKKFIKTIEKEK